ncbi:TPA: hypothetical protein ACMDRQ_003432 [Vibrio cholerae]
MQPYRDDEKNNLFKRVLIEAKKKNLIGDLKSMSDSIIGSEILGYALYDEAVFPVMKNIDRDFFAQNYLVILESMTMAGTYDSYILLVRQVIGVKSRINFEVVAPAHLKINIWSIESDRIGLVTRDKEGILIRDGSLLCARMSTSKFKIRQLEKVMYMLATAAGIYLEIEFTRPKVDYTYIPEVGLEAMFIPPQKISVSYTSTEALKQASSESKVTESSIESLCRYRTKTEAQEIRLEAMLQDKDYGI